MRFKEKQRRGMSLSGGKIKQTGNGPSRCPANVTKRKVLNMQKDTIVNIVGRIVPKTPMR